MPLYKYDTSSFLKSPCGGFRGLVFLIKHVFRFNEVFTFPRCFHLFENSAASNHFNILVEVDGSCKTCVWTTIIVVMELFHWDTHFLNYIFFFDTGTEYIWFIKLNQFFHFMVT